MNWKSLGEAADWASVLARDLVNESKSDGMRSYRVLTGARLTYRQIKLRFSFWSFTSP